jgi:amidohydrolase
MNVAADLPAVIDELEPDLIAWRRRLHANPELSFHEHETAAFVEQTLGGLDGLEVSRPAPTAVMARLVGARPGPTVALRADMDALPIQEENEFEFASTRPGVMHACGHDGHTAMLLAVARILAVARQELPGEVRFLFQHAEELLPGGAQELVAVGVMEGVDWVLGAHLMTVLDTGRVAVLPGPELAAADMFEITVRGMGGHGALPHETVDPIAIGAQLVGALQHVVSRQTDPLESVVVSVTRILGGTANNIIPETVLLGGTARTFSPTLRVRTRESIERIARGVTDAYDATFDFDWMDGYAAVVNDPEVAGLVAGEARELLGHDAVQDIPPIMGGDDFSAYLAEAPGAYLLVGARSEVAGSTYPHHHPRFTIDERALRNGVGVLARSTLALLERCASH